MKWLTLIGLVFSFNLFAGQLEGDFRGQELFEIMTTKHTQLANETCIALGVRRSLDNQDLHIALGHFIDSATLKEGFAEIPSNSGTFKKVLHITVQYKDHQNNDVASNTFSCLYKK